MFGAKTDLTVKEMLELMQEINIDKDDYFVIVTGKQGITGKTWLCQQLRELGFRTNEVSGEEVLKSPIYKESKNYFLLDKELGYIIIILNKRVKKGSLND